MAIALALHLLGAIVWIGGMFFAHMALRPALEALIEPPRRLELMRAILGRFFVWVWLSLLGILASGYWIFFGVYQGKMGMHVHLMQGTGLLMVLLFMFVYFIPFRRLSKAVSIKDYPSAATQLRLIRGVILTNLILGLITVIIAVTKY